MSCSKALYKMKRTLPVSKKNIHTDKALLLTLDEEHAHECSGDKRHEQMVAQELAACQAQSLDHVTSQDTSSGGAGNGHYSCKATRVGSTVLHKITLSRPAPCPTDTHLLRPDCPYAKCFINSSKVVTCIM